MRCDMKAAKIKDILIIISLFFVSNILIGCASTPKTFHKADYSNTEDYMYGKSDRLTDLEAQISKLDKRVGVLDTNVEGLREYVTSETLIKPAAPLNINLVEVTSDEIRVNGETVSDEDLITYLELLQVCDKDPLLVASPKAELHKVTWVVECLHHAGCSNILVDGTNEQG